MSNKLNDNNYNLTKIFVYVALIFGTLLCILVPPFQSPDEDSHFRKAYAVSSLQLYPKVIDGKYGYKLDTSLIDYIETKKGYSSDLYKKYSFGQLYFEQFVPRVYTGDDIYYFSTVDVPFVGYIAPAIGIDIGKAVFKITFDGASANYAYLLYFARFFNLLLFIIITAIAISKTPILKKTMTAIALLPMPLFLSSSVSYDGIMISGTLLLFALGLNIIYNSKIKVVTKKSLIPFILIGIILFNIKYVYIPLFAILFFIPKEKFVKNKKIKTLAILFAIILCISLLLKMPYSLLDIPKDYATNSSAQLEWIISNPLKFLSILFSNIFDQTAFQFNMLIGGMGLIDTHLPGIIVFILSSFILLLGLAEISLEKIKIILKNKIVLFLSLSCIVCSIYSALYIVWTSNVEIGSKIIIGVQGRYFIPIMIYMYLLFSNRIKNKFFERICRVIVDNHWIITILGLTVAVFVIVLRYWC